MNPYKMFKTEEKMEAGGIELDYGDFKFRIARAGGSNTKYTRLLAKRLKPYQRQMDMGVLENDVADRLMAGIYADSVILGWEGVTDADGNPMEFTRENCVTLFLDLPGLFSDIREQAQKAVNFRAEALENAAKN